MPILGNATDLPLGDVSATAFLEILTAASIAQLYRNRDGPRASIGKETRDHARHLLLTSPAFRALDRQRGHGHARTRTMALREHVCGASWIRREHEAEAAHLPAPPRDEQALAAAGITYEGRVGYRTTKRGGNRGVLHLDLEKMRPLLQHARVAELVDHFVQILRESGTRLAYNKPFHERSEHERRASRRAHNKTRAQRLAKEALGTRRAFERILIRVLDIANETKRLPNPARSTAFDEADIEASEERAGWRELVRRRLAKIVVNPLTSRRTFLVNLRAFSGWARSEAEDIRRELLPNNRYVAL